jgi:competence protein CoiA
MKYALVCGKKTEATKGAIGFCSGCGSEMIAKCGEVKIHHWAHKGKLHCDHWWEPETEWHRAWKNHFPMDWQEVVYKTEVGEKHIADVQLSNGLVIEFQRSPIDPEERTSRENFYKNMIWVVDGTRLKRDYPRFIKLVGTARATNLEGYSLVDFPEKYFPLLGWIVRFR